MGVKYLSESRIYFMVLVSMLFFLLMIGVYSAVVCEIERAVITRCKGLEDEDPSVAAEEAKVKDYENIEDYLQVMCYTYIGGIFMKVPLFTIIQEHTSSKSSAP